MSVWGQWLMFHCISDNADSMLFFFSFQMVFWPAKESGSREAVDDAIQYGGLLSYS